MLIGGYGPGHAVIYTDFEKFKRINAKYGYRVGDQILRQFSEYVISVLKTDMDVYFTRRSLIILSFSLHVIWMLIRKHLF